MKTLYTAHATSTAGRAGSTRTDDGQIALQLSMPGSGKSGSNPEQLFACGYSACFGGAVEAVAKMQKIQIGAVTVKADVNLLQDDNHGYAISAALDVTVADVDDATAQTLVQKAHEVCPYSKATRGNIEVTLKVSGQALKAAA